MDILVEAAFLFKQSRMTSKRRIAEFACSVQITVRLWISSLGPAVIGSVSEFDIAHGLFFCNISANWTVSRN